MAADHWRDRNVLITGATGLLGGWLTRHLVERGANAVALVRDHVPGAFFMREGDDRRTSVVRGDIRDQPLMERVLGEYEIDTVFHLAAQTIVGIANRNAVSTFESNIGGTWSLLEAVRRSPTVRAVVVASSDKAYGEVETLPYTEATPMGGVHPYDVSKSCADLIAQCYAKTWNAPVAITRCGNFFGGGDLNWNRIVPGTIRSLLRGEAPVIRSDGRYLRDYIYIEDAVAAYLDLAAALHQRPELRGEAFNFSTETPRTVLEMVAAISALMGVSIAPDIRNEASNEIRAQYLDAAKAKRVLGWTPRFGLDEGLRRTVDWYRRHLGAAA